MSSVRGPSFAPEEDSHLCDVYLDISQCPIIGINQSKDTLWKRVHTQYNSTKKDHMPIRNQRALDSRMGLINKAMGKLRGAIRQVERLNPSGASEKDIVSNCYFLFH